MWSARREVFAKGDIGGERSKWRRERGNEGGEEGNEGCFLQGILRRRGQEAFAVKAAKFGRSRVYELLREKFWEKLYARMRIYVSWKLNSNKIFKLHELHLSPRGIGVYVFGLGDNIILFPMTMNNMGNDLFKRKFILYHYF